MVTFHHFTTPLWLADQGGWERDDMPERFAAYCEKAAARLDGLMERACTINEPSMVSTIGYLAGPSRPASRIAMRATTSTRCSCASHRAAVDAIRANAPGVPVGITLAMSDYQAVDGGESKLDQIRRSMEDVFFDATTGDDFVGVQTYSRTRVGPTACSAPRTGVPTLIMGYEYYPESLAATIRRAWEYTKGEVPIIVTENGIGTDDDAQRIAYVRTALEGVLAVHRRRDRRARLHVLEPARQLRVGLRLRPPVRHRRLRPPHLRAHPEGERPLARAASPQANALVVDRGGRFASPSCGAAQAPAP